MDLETQTPYPDTGAMAVGARLAFGLAVLIIVLAVIAPGWLVPRMLRSHYLEHFAAFYVAALAGAAAMPRMQIRRLGTGYLLFALAMSALQLIQGASLKLAINNWVADAGGTAAALAPIVVQRFRSRFPPR
jgi:hypothetical protein